MKVLHVISCYVPAYSTGGPVLSVHSLNKWLVRAGVAVTVYTTNLGEKGTLLNVPLNQPVMIDGVEVWYFPLCGPRKWEYSYALHRALKERISGFDIVHLDSMFRAATVLGSHYARAHRKPYIISPRGVFMKEPLARKRRLIKKIYIELIERRNLKHASAIHFTSEVEKGEYLAASLPLKKAIVIPNGLDPKALTAGVVPGSFRKKLGIALDKKIILFLGRLAWKKGFDTLIPAFREVAEKETGSLLVIAEWSDENYKSAVLKLIDQCSLRGRVILTKINGDTERNNVFHDSDVFVLPSYAESFGMAVAQAMLAGLPVIVTEGVGLATDIAREKAGVVIKKEERALAEAMLSLLRNPRAAADMGRCGKALMERDYGEPVVARRFMEEYRNIIALHAS